MHTPISRRQLLTTSIAAAAAAGTPLFRSSSAAAADAQRLTPTTRSLDVNGKPARVFGLIGPGGKSGLTLAPGERFRVDLANAIDGPTIIHWHGQLPPWTEDGFPWPQVPALPAGTTRSYDYQPISGTYWMHSHHGLQEQSLMTAPLIVQSASEAREDRQEIVVMLHDFSFRAPLELLAGLTGTTVAAAERMRPRRKTCHPRETRPPPPMALSPCPRACLRRACLRQALRRCPCRAGPQPISTTSTTTPFSPTNAPWPTRRWCACRPAPASGCGSLMPHRRASSGSTSGM